MEEQVVTLCAATGKVMLDVPVVKLKAFQMEMLKWFEEAHTEIMNELRTGKDLGDDLKNRLRMLQRLSSLYGRNRVNNEWLTHVKFKAE